MNKRITRTIKDILKIQRESIKKKGTASPGILLFTDNGFFYYLNTYNSITKQDVPIEVVVNNVLIPNLKNVGPSDIIEYYVCFTSPDIVEGLAGDGSSIIKPNEVSFTKLIILHGTFDYEEIRQYWMPTLKEDRTNRLHIAERTHLTAPIYPFVVADPGIYRGDLLSSPRTYNKTWLDKVYKS